MNPENPPPPNNNDNQYSANPNPSPTIAPQNNDQAITPTTNPEPPTSFNPQIVVSEHNSIGSHVNTTPNFTKTESSFSRRRLVLVVILVLIVSSGSIAGGLSLISKNQKPFQAASNSGNGTPSGLDSI